MRVGHFLRPVAALVLGIAILPSAARADEKLAPMKENPEYTYWAKCKAGATTTMAGEAESQGQKVGMEMTVTLVEVEKDKLTLERKVTIMVGGQTINQPAAKEVVTPAPKPGELYKETGEEEITVAGKTLKCKVYQMEQGEGPAKMAAKTWVNDTVPGGAVKMEMKGAAMSGTFTVKSFDAK